MPSKNRSKLRTINDTMTPENEERLRQMWLDGVHLKVIAAKLGCSGDKVLAVRKRLGLLGRNPLAGDHATPRQIRPHPEVRFEDYTVRSTGVGLTIDALCRQYGIQRQQRVYGEPEYG